MRNRTHLFLLLTLMGLTLTTPLHVSAAQSDSLTVENHIRTGDINIELKEYQIDENGKEQLYTFDDYVLPGDCISKIPRITNLAEPCYIRVLLTFPEPESSQIQGLSVEQLQGISDRWIYKGGYYYYPDILNTGDSIDFFKSVSIPSSYKNEYAKKELSLSIQVDAIQSQNFTPDFSSDTPWGTQMIEICAHNQANPKIQNPYQSLYVEYEGNSHKLITASDDFFSNLSTLMPGDTLSDELLLKNTTNSEAEFFFHTQVPDTLSDEALQLLDQLTLEIFLDGELLYRGSLKSTVLEDRISLGIYKSGDTKRFRFAISMPETLTNTYALRETSIKWIFSVENEELIISTPPPVKTGDSLDAKRYFVLMILSTFMFGTYAIYQKRKGENYLC